MAAEVGADARNLDEAARARPAAASAAAPPPPRPPSHKNLQSPPNTQASQRPRRRNRGRDARITWWEMSRRRTSLEAELSRTPSLASSAEPPLASL